MDVRRPDLRTRLLSWVICGPLGHLYGGVLDWGELALRLAVARARGRRLGDL